MEKAVEAGTLLGLASFGVGYFAHVPYRTNIAAALAIGVGVGYAVAPVERQIDACEIVIGKTKLVAQLGNVALQQDVDAVVNAANRNMGDGGGVSGALYAEDRKNHGGKMAAAVKALNRTLKPGEAASTIGLGKQVIHVLGPVYSKQNHDRCCADLRAAYQSLFREAEQIGAKKVACVYISAELYHFPAEPAAQIAFETTRDYLQKHPNAFTEVRFVCIKNSPVHQAFIRNATR